MLDHSRFLISITEAAEAGCQICDLLCQHFNSDPQREPADELNLQSFCRVFRSSAKISCDFRYVDVDGKSRFKLYEFLECRSM
jgi:hypothetical protein